MMSDDRWRSDEHAREWLAKQGQQPTDRTEQFELIARLLPFAPEQPLLMADLGAGHGTLTEVLLKAFPKAKVMCLDLNATMIAAGKERLAPYVDRYRYVTVDLAEDKWPDDAPGPFDAVV